MEYFNSEDPNSLISIAQNNSDSIRTWTARLSEIASTCLHLDHVKSVYQEAGYQLAKLVNAFDVSEKLPVALGGSVLIIMKLLNNHFYHI